MRDISTHVLDITLGKPAAGVGIRLEKLDEEEWLTLAESATDSDGRCRNLASAAAPGLYRLVFDIGRYFDGQNRISIYPEACVTFHCRGEANYHLPLLLSNHSYTTYRGS